MLKFEKKIRRQKVNITKDEIESLLGAKKNVALEANTEVKRDTPAGILFMSRNQNAGQIQNMIISNNIVRTFHFTFWYLKM